jgi:hypothetical protein
VRSHEGVAERNRAAYNNSNKGEHLNQRAIAYKTPNAVKFDSPVLGRENLVFLEY